jgi:hypothetical protein
MQKTRLKIIKETIEIYGSDPSKRSVDEATNECQYNGPDGKHCGAGRCFNPGVIEPSDEGRTIEVLIIIYGDKILFKPEYQGHRASFWMEIQKFHDDDENFTETGLSEEGKAFAKELRINYGK